MLLEFNYVERFHIVVIFSTIIIMNDSAINDVNPQSAARCRKSEFRIISMVKLFNCMFNIAVNNMHVKYRVHSWAKVFVITGIFLIRCTIPFGTISSIRVV